jgi:predicted nucleic acid-binding protein
MVPLQTPVIPDNATPQACMEILDAYTRYLHEQASPTFGQDSERARKVRGSADWCATTLAYYLGFLVGPDGSATGVTHDVLEQIAELRHVYEIPNIEDNAQKMAVNLAKRTRASAKEAAQRRQQARSTPPAAPTTASAPSATLDAADALEAAMARTYGLTIDQYREALKDIANEEA